MADCVAVVTDLIFSTRITGTAQQLGVTCAVARSISRLQERLASEPPRLALVDMNADGVSGGEAIRAIKAGAPGIHVVAYLSHVQRELAAEAEAAGADEVLPRSAFVQRLPDLLRGASTGAPKPDATGEG